MKKSFALAVAATGLCLGLVLGLAFPLFAQSEKSLYMTVRRYEGVTDTREAGRLVKESFVPLISQMPGFVAYYWVDAGGGVIVSTSVFESQGAAEESTAKAKAWNQEHVASLVPNPPQVTAGRVVAHMVK